MTEQPGFGLYVHWPWCASKCPYCDFNSHVGGADGDAWREAIIGELARAAGETGGRPLTSIFFGGGTPSLMAPAAAAAVLDAAAGLWPLAETAEITLEANPTSADAARFQGFRAAGVNRLSIGVQALDNDALRWLGREHSAAEALAALAAGMGQFSRVNLDLIYARPGQTLAAWESELAQAVALGARHLSVYQLTIEPGTQFHRARIAAAEEGLAADMFEATRALLADAGLPAYEVSNHAAMGQECRHNLDIWRGGDYVGVGPGAHGRITSGGVTTATYQYRDPAKWLENAQSGRGGSQTRSPLSADQRLREILLLGLRLSGGITHGTFRALTGRRIAEATSPGALIKEGYLLLDGQGLRATPEGVLRLNGVIAALVKD